MSNLPPKTFPRSITYNPPLSTTMTDLLNTIPFLIKDISTRLDQQDLSLLNISSQLKNNKPNYKYSTNIHVTSSVPLIPPSSPSPTTYTYP